MSLELNVPAMSTQKSTGKKKRVLGTCAMNGTSKTKATILGDAKRCLFTSNKQGSPSVSVANLRRSITLKSNYSQRSHAPKPAFTSKNPVPVQKSMNQSQIPSKNLVPLQKSMNQSQILKPRIQSQSQIMKPSSSNTDLLTEMNETLQEMLDENKLTNKTLQEMSSETKQSIALMAGAIESVHKTLDKVLQFMSAQSDQKGLSETFSETFHEDEIRTGCSALASVDVSTSALGCAVLNDSHIAAGNSTVSGHTVHKAYNDLRSHFPNLLRTPGKSDVPVSATPRTIISNRVLEQFGELYDKS